MLEHLLVSPIGQGSGRSVAHSEREIQRLGLSRRVSNTLIDFIAAILLKGSKGA